MGAVEERQDARAVGDFVKAFKLSQKILDRKTSKRLMAAEIEQCLADLEALGRLDLLPGHFADLSVYGQRDVLLAINLE